MITEKPRQKNWKAITGAKRKEGYKAASEGLPLSSCRLPQGAARTAWLSGWWKWQSDEKNKDAADGRGTSEHSRDPKSSMRSHTRSMFLGMNSPG